MDMKLPGGDVRNGAKGYPLAEALSGYAGSARGRFHMPGHKGSFPGSGMKGNPASPIHRALAEAMTFDVTELPGLDDLSAPDGAIAELEGRLAALYGAKASFLSVGGSTLGLQAAIMAACGEGDVIILPRDSHRAAISGVVLAGALPYYILPELDKVSGLTLGPTPQAYEAAFEAVACSGRRAAAALVTSPTYFGSCPPVAAIAGVCRRRGAMCLVDEAHGAHLRFAPGAPPDALACGAHIVAQSPHKTLPALTQTAWLHAGDGVDAARVKDRLLLLQTSSPSYLLMASMEAAIAWLEGGPEADFAGAAGLCRELRLGAESLGYKVFLKAGDMGLPEDPLKAFVGPGPGMPINGYGLNEGLMAEGIYPELANPLGCLFMFGAGTVEEEVLATLKALESVAYGRGSGIVGTAPVAHGKGFLGPRGYPAIPPRQAVLGGYEEIALDSAVGRISAVAVAPSPPSVGIILPGDVIPAEAVSAIEEFSSAHAKVHGVGSIHDGEGRRIRVVAEPRLDA